MMVHHTYITTPCRGSAAKSNASVTVHECSHVLFACYLNRNSHRNRNKEIRHKEIKVKSLLVLVRSTSEKY